MPGASAQTNQKGDGWLTCSGSPTTFPCGSFRYPFLPPFSFSLFIDKDVNLVKGTQTVNTVLMESSGTDSIMADLSCWGKGDGDSTRGGGRDVAEISVPW